VAARPCSRPPAWLKDQLVAAGDGPLAIVVFAYARPIPAVGTPMAVETARGHTRIVVSVEGVSYPAEAVLPSVGEALYPDDGTDAGELIDRARAKLKLRIH
jgi:hypothetical protein